MIRIGHLTDLHVIEARPERRDRATRARLSLLNVHRATVDPPERRARVLAALEAARRACVDHLVVTGDLTEDGTPEQFEALAEVLWASRVPPCRITLVPGNHDAYTSEGAFERALRGPLARYAATSHRGAVVTVGGAAVVALWTSMHQAFTRSAGALRADEAAVVGHALRDRRTAGRPVIAALHHPPFARRTRALDWLDGLDGHDHLGRILRDDERAHALFGHLHRAVDRAVRAGARPRAFGAPSVVDGPSPLRVYRVEGPRLVAEGAADARERAA